MATLRFNHPTRHLAFMTLGSFLYFPLWWYTRGLLKTLRGARSFVADRAADFGLRYWIRNIFRPMYGVSDWQGRTISFMMRLAAITWYSLLLLLCTVLALAFVVVYLMVLPLTLFMIWHQLNGRYFGI